MTAGRGTLVLVVGPSGVGKDSVIGGARNVLAGDPGVLFPRRFITRPADAGGEDHVALDAAGFARLRDSGGLLLSWQAHGLDYGVPAAVDSDLAAGRVVVVNVSRTVVAAARARLRPVSIVSITAPEAVLAERLAARGREDARAIAARLARAPVPPEGADVVAIDNGGALDAAVADFVALLQRLRPAK